LQLRSINRSLPDHVRIGTACPLIVLKRCTLPTARCRDSGSVAKGWHGTSTTPTRCNDEEGKDKEK